ncbi:MAG: hypothetical protein H7289_11405 [Mucilaginibacter sp.]|nr:hypothetical protein [Mucilaginibacter sp.]
MKITLKALIYSFFFICLGTAAKAQLNVPDSLRIGIGAEIASTTTANFGTGVNSTSGSDAAAVYNYGVGLALRVDIPVLSNLYVTASGGYTSFLTSKNATNSQQAITGVTLPNFNIIPLKIGAKVFIGGDRFYAHGEVGETFLANKAALYAVYSRSFTWAPGLGLVLPLKKRHTYIDAGIRIENTQSFYNANNTNTFWGFHFAYALNLK